MKRFLALLVCLVLLAPFSALAATEDYTVAGKLVRQLWAGSGFSGTLTVDVTDGQGASTLQKPVQVNVDYIYVRPTEEEPGEHRADLTLMDGESASSAAHVQVKGGVLALQADVISPDWYSFAPRDTENQTQLDQAADSLLAQTGVPDLASTAIKALAGLQTSDALDEMIDAYTTRIDLWIEGYRQEAVLDKLKDGTTTMQVSYQVPAQAIKAQVKQMVLDLLSDQTALETLADALGQDLPLNPKLQSYYFQAVDDLPLTGDMTLSRTVSLKNETLALHLSLPLYDAQGGAVTLTYDRTKGDGDLPDDNVIAVESGLRRTQLTYQEYQSMTDVQVVRGTLRSQPLGDTQAETLAVAFTLRQEQAESTDEEKRDVYTHNLTLNLSRDGEEGVDIPAMDITLESRFVSKPQKSAATEVDAKLTVTGDELEQGLVLTLQGKSRKKWEPEALPQDMIYVREMTREDMAALLPGAAARGLALLGAYAQPPAEPAETAQPAETANP